MIATRILWPKGSEGQEGKMKNRQFSFVFALFLMSALVKVPVFGQAAQTSSSLTTPGDRFLCPTVVSLSDGTIIFGLLIGMEGDGLVVRVGKELRTIPLDTIARVRIDMEKDNTSFALSGILMGAYLGNILFYGTKPSIFREKSGSFLGDFLITGGGAGAGFGLGYLVSSLGLRTKHLFDLSKSGVEKYAEWERLKKFVLGVESATPRFHIFLQAAHVFFRASEQSQATLKKAGYSDSLYGPGFWSYDQASAFNLLRSVRACFSLSHDLKIGAAAYFVGEPDWGTGKWDTLASYNISQKLSGTGYYVTAEFGPLASKLPKGISWDAGAGLGAAQIAFEFQTDVYASYPNYGYQRSDRSFRRWFASGVIFTTLGLNLTQSLMLGLTADYVWIPTRDIKGIPEAQIPTQKIQFGNSSVGLVMRWHF
jgi:hypothetical protein